MYIALNPTLGTSMSFPTAVAIFRPSLFLRPGCLSVIFFCSPTSHRAAQETKERGEGAGQGWKSGYGHASRRIGLIGPFLFRFFFVLKGVQTRRRDYSFVFISFCLENRISWPTEPTIQPAGYLEIRGHAIYSLFSYLSPLTEWVRQRASSQFQKKSRHTIHIQKDRTRTACWYENARSSKSMLCASL